VSSADSAHLASELRSLAASRGVAFFGIADLSPVAASLRELWPLDTSELPRGISMGIRLDDAILDRLLDRPSPETAAAYWDACYGAINCRLEAVAGEVAEALRAAGHAATAVGATATPEEGVPVVPISHKAVARMAGLGWIGRSCLLVTPSVGPRARWVTVITDAPLRPTGSPMEVGCGDCTLCVDRCPAGAFSGQAFDPEHPLALRLDPKKCAPHIKQAGVCGLCIAVCPHGRQPDR